MEGAASGLGHRAVEMHAKKLEIIIDELKSVHIRTSRKQLFEYFSFTYQTVKDRISEATTEELEKLANEIQPNGKKTKKYTPLVTHETNRLVRKTLLEEKEELTSQFHEYLITLSKLECDFEALWKSRDESDKVVPSTCGIVELGNLFAIEHRRMVNRLPIYAWKSRIIEAIDGNQFVVLKGETGSGKSTQLPQYFMEAVLHRYPNQKVICTQLRKVAAISLAHRIAEEQREKVGQKVGYWVGMNKNSHENTQLLLMTDRVLLNHCLENPTLEGICCVIIDEAHERSVNTDLLLGMVKEAAKGRPDLKIVVTSATISTKLFSDYFYGCPVIEVPGRIFPVEEIFETTSTSLEKNQEYVKKAALKALEIHLSEEKGDILVFLTSPAEVDIGVVDFERMANNTNKSYKVLPLHGKLQSEDQMKVFEVLADARKIVFATNVAETSVTIPGIKFVVDSGMVKERFYDAKRGLNYLDVRMISKSSAIQRKGRAGRTGPGKCIRMYRKADFDDMDDSNQPEIKKMHLGSAVLNLMALGVRDVTSFDFIEPPDRETLVDSIKTLRMLGALTDRDELTLKGQDMSKIPLDPRGACMTLDGMECGCEEEAITLAAVCTFSSNFYIRIGDDENKKLADEKKVRFCREEGDLVSMVHVYNKWTEQGGKKERNEWCVMNHLNAKTMRSISDLIREINHALKSIRPRIQVGEESKSKHKSIKKQRYNEKTDRSAAEVHRSTKKNIKVKKCTEAAMMEQSPNEARLQSLTDTRLKSSSDFHATTEHWSLSQEPLLHLIIKAYYDNIAFYTGHSRLGYLSPKHKELFVVHPSSVLRTLALEPKFVVFQDVLKTTSNFLIGLTPVSLNTVQPLCPHPDFEINFDDAKNIEVVTTIMKPFGPTVTRSLIVKRGETIKELTRKIRGQNEHPGILEVHPGDGSVVIHTTRARSDQAKQIVLKHIDSQIEILENASREEDIGGVTKTCHRVLLKSGFLVQQYLSPDEAMEFKVQVCREEAELTDDRIRQVLLNAIIMFNDVKSLEPINGNCWQIQQDNKMKVMFDLATVCFEKGVNVKEIEGKIHGLSTIWYKVMGFPKLSMSQSGIKDSRGVFEVILTWQRRVSRGIGFIQTPLEHERNYLLRQYQRLPGTFRYSADVNNVNQIFVRNIEREIDDKSFRNMLEPLCNEILREEFNDRQDVTSCKASLVYPKAEPCDLEEEFKEYQELITKSFAKSNLLKLHIFPVKQGTTSCKAIASFANPEDAGQAVQYANEGFHIRRPDGGLVRLKAELKKNLTIFCKKIVFDSLHQEISEAERDGKNYNVVVKITDGKARQSKTIYVSGTDSFMFMEISNRLLQLLKPEEVGQLKVSKHQFDLMKTKIEHFEKQIGSVKCEFDTRLGKLWVYGNHEKKKKLNNALVELHGAFALHETHQVNLRGEDKAPGLLRALIVEYGVDFKWALLDMHGIVQVDIRQQSVTFSGSHAFCTKINRLIDGRNKALKRGMKTRSKSTRLVHESESLCSLCLCEVGAQRHRLELCGHIYCTSCLQQFLESCTRDKKFPITCCEDDCETKLAIKDIVVLLGEEEAVKEMAKASIASFIMKNPTDFGYCLTPDCPMIYRKKPNSNLRCSLCKKEYCFRCDNELKGPICDQCYQADVKVNVMAWKDGKDVKQCPYCKNFIEKNGGCMHVACRCGSHLCWKCLKNFARQSECYDHLPHCGGIFQ